MAVKKKKAAKKKAAPKKKAAARKAKIILNGVKKNKSRIFIGLDARLLDLSQRLFPKHYHKTWLFFIPLLTMLRNKKPLKSIE